MSDKTTETLRLLDSIKSLEENYQTEPPEDLYAFAISGSCLAGLMHALISDDLLDENTKERVKRLLGIHVVLFELTREDLEADMYMLKTVKGCIA
jgi:hypothetical protein